MTTHNASIVAPGLTEVARPAAWSELVNLVEGGARGETLVSGLLPLRDELHRLDVPDPLVESIVTGLRTGQWNEAVLQLGLARGARTLFYLGPLRTRENEETSLGLLLGALAPEGPALVNEVEDLATPLGHALFGFPCHFWGRQVELYDLALAAGGFARRGAGAIALFVPFYLGGWVDDPRLLEARRTIFMVNLVSERFRQLALPLGSEISLDGQPLVDEAESAGLRSAFGTWLALHELLHGSGPLPFFKAPSPKLALGLEFGALEEFRVDASFWLCLAIAEDVLGARADLARRVLLADRLLRSARLGVARYGPRAGIRRSVDGEHGALWWSLLRSAGRLRCSDPVALHEVLPTLQAHLAEHYRREEAARKALEPTLVLRQWAEDLRRRLFGDDHRLSADIYDRLTGWNCRMPDSLSLSFPLIAARS